MLTATAPGAATSATVAIDVVKVYGTGDCAVRALHGVSAGSARPSSW